MLSKEASASFLVSVTHIPNNIHTSDRAVTNTTSLETHAFA